MIAESLISLEESEFLEFKSYWYWSGEGKDKQKEWGEFLKDFASMFNTLSSEKSKYIIIGYDEKTKVKNNYYVDKAGNIIEPIKDLENLKIELIKRVSRNFRAIFHDQTVDVVDSLLGECFTMKISMVDDCCLLVLSFKNPPFILELKNNSLLKQLINKVMYLLGN